MDQAKRECILDAAVRAFRRLGFRKTSIDDVANEAKVGKGTVYLAVKSKDELYLRAVDRELASWLADHVVLAQDYSRDGLAKLVLSEIETARRRDLVHPALSGRIADTVDVDVAALRATARANLLTALEAARTAGRFRKDLDVSTAGELLQAIEIAALSAHPSADPPAAALSQPTVEAIQRAVDQLIRGFVAA